jgi:hypothetical protein
MGLALWIAAGLTAFAAARLMPFLRPRVVGELVAAVASAVTLGAAATALDFGGWREPDWRAGLFVLLGTFAAIALRRSVLQLIPRADAGSAAPPDRVVPRG